MPSPGKPSLTVVVPATDAPPTLERCLSAIRSSDEPPEEVLVVRAPGGAGPAEARNAGARDARGEVLVFVDSDVAVHPDALGRIRAAFAADPGLTALFGGYDAFPAAPGVVSRFRNLLHHHVHQEGAGPAGTFWAGLGAIRRDAFETAGGFDARRYPAPSVEDIDLGVRVAAAGGGIRLDSAILGTHLKRWTLAGMLRTDLLARGAPWIALVLRTGASRGALNLGWRHRVSALACTGAAGAALARRPALAAGAAAGFLALNRPFHRLLVTRLGPARACAGIALHVLHHLTAVASVPVGVAVHLRERGR